MQVAISISRRWLPHHHDPGPGKFYKQHSPQCPERFWGMWLWYTINGGGLYTFYFHLNLNNIADCCHLSLLITANWLSLSDLFHDKMRLAVGPCWRFGSPSLSEFKLNPPDWLDPQPSIRELDVEMWKAPPKKAHKLMKMVFQCLRLDSNYCMYLEIDDNLCDSSQLLSGWDNSRLNQIVKIVCGVGSAHKRPHTLDVLQQQWGKGDEQSSLVFWGPESHWVEFNVFKSVVVSAFTTSKIVHLSLKSMCPFSTR